MQKVTTGTFTASKILAPKLLNLSMAVPHSSNTAPFAHKCTHFSRLFDTSPTNLAYLAYTAFQALIQPPAQLYVTKT